VKTPEDIQMINAMLHYNSSISYYDKDSDKVFDSIL